MYYLNRSYEDPHSNLAFDEALLEAMESLASQLSEKSELAKERGEPAELLRFWQMSEPCVVVGRSSKIAEEVHLDRCERDSVPVLRRMSGGGTIVAGPGCAMFSVLLSLDARPECRSLDGAHRTVMTRVCQAMQCSLDEYGIDQKVDIRGICDLTIDGQKISGNALRLKRHWLMYHGTLLIDMPLQWISEYLAMPPKQPEYRQGRSHDQFVTGLGERIREPGVFQAILERALQRVWQADQPWAGHPFAAQADEQVRGWLERRYRDSSWHAQR
jgi:lipoate-protein ligase A